METNIEVPEYFICPISLQIMKDPVTTISGITYDRESIEHWLYKTHNTICPVTKQSLSINSDLTQNHTLRRLIQSWCTLNAVDRIPTPKPPLTIKYISNLIQNLSIPKLQKLGALAEENDRNGAHMVQAGLLNGLVPFIISCYRNRDVNGLEECLCLFYSVRGSLFQSNGPLTENNEIIDSLIWILGIDFGFSVVKLHASFVLNAVLQKANPGMFENLKPEFFRCVLENLKDGICKTITISLLEVLLNCCSRGENRVMMIESGAIFYLIEIELTNGPEKKITELILGILYNLCLSADGRAQLLNHSAGIAVVSRRILKVSSTADDHAVLIIWLICKYFGTDGVLKEMLKVGTVRTLCMVIQANCALYLKEKAREILRMHFDVWKDSPCIEVATLTRYTK